MVCYHMLCNLSLRLFTSVIWFLFMWTPNQNILTGKGLSIKNKIYFLVKFWFLTFLLFLIHIFQWKSRLQESFSDAAGWLGELGSQENHFISLISTVSSLRSAAPANVISVATLVELKLLSHHNYCQSRHWTCTFTSNFYRVVALENSFFGKVSRLPML